MHEFFKTWRMGDMRPAPFAFKSSVAVLMALIAMINIQAGARWESKLAGVALCAYAVASVIFPWGWTVPCIIIGTFIGLMMDGPVKGGSAVSQIWETVRWIGFGFGAGCAVGLVLDWFTADICRCDVTVDGKPPETF